MCDETTDAEHEAHLAEKRIARRQLAQLGAGAAALVVWPGCSSAPPPAPAEAAPGRAPDAKNSASRRVLVRTPDGEADGFFVAPAGGPHPGVLLWPDVAGLREAYETMATRLAEAGYAVLAINHYYRSARAPIVSSFAEWRTDAGKAKLQPMIDALDAAAITRDAAALVAWLDAQPEVDARRKLGTCGYCMGGPYTFRTAAAAPARIGALASFHGAKLVVDAPDSPHRLLGAMEAALLVAIAKSDDEKQPEAKEELRAAAGTAHRAAEIEVYPAPHGWCTLDSPVYDEPQAERAWGRMLATFQSHL